MKMMLFTVRPVGWLRDHLHMHMRQVLVLLLALSVDGLILSAQAPASVTVSARAAPMRSKSPWLLAQPSTKAKRPIGATGEPSGKIPGLTKLGAVKPYLLLAATVWAIVGSIAN